MRLLFSICAMFMQTQLPCASAQQLENKHQEDFPVSELSTLTATVPEVQPQIFDHITQDEVVPNAIVLPSSWISERSYRPTLDQYRTDAWLRSHFVGDPDEIEAKLIIIEQLYRDICPTCDSGVILPPTPVVRPSEPLPPTTPSLLCPEADGN